MKSNITASLWLLVTGIQQFGFCSFIYYLLTYSRDLSSCGRWSYGCRAMSSVSLLLKLLLSALKWFFLALLHFLHSPSSIHWNVIKIFLSVYCYQSEIWHWFTWLLDEAWNEWKKKELMVYSREQIIDEVRAITKMESPDLCPALTQKWQRLSKLIRVCVGLRHVEAGCGLPKEKQKPAWKWFILGRKNITTSSEWMNQ